jgi:Domain of unknown function (DUF4145)
MMDYLIVQPLTPKGGEPPMANAEQPLSENVTCGHCGNVAPMRFAYDGTAVEPFDDGKGNWWDAGMAYETLHCPRCKSVTLRRYYSHSYMDGSDIPTYEILYPAQDQRPLGLPERVEKAFDAANNVKHLDANSYGTNLGRVLDRVCDNLGAKPDRFLANRLSELHTAGTIPSGVFDLAGGIKSLRIIAAHADAGELTPQETPMLERATRLFLEHIYTAPHLAEKAKQRADELRAKEAAGTP